MKILFINDVYTVGGATKSLKDMLGLLINKGVETIVCTSRKDELNDWLEKKGITYIVDGHNGVMEVALEKSILRPARYLKRKIRYRKARKRALQRIEKEIDISAIDIVHTNSARNDIGCLIHEKYGIPHLMHIREFGQEDFSCWVYHHNYYKYISIHSNQLVAVSNAVKQSWIKKGVWPDKIMTLYNGINFDNFQIKGSQTYNQEKLRIVFVGGLCETKGQHIAVEAISILPKDIRKNIKLDFIGWCDPEYLACLEKSVQGNNLGEQIHFLGSRDDVSELLCKYDVGLMCSKAEGFGRVTVEYMYVGLGVIAADTGASPELVENELTGLIYSRDDATDLAAKIERFYNDRELLQNCGQKAHFIAAEKYSIERNVAELMQVYQRLSNRTLQ